MGQQQLLLLVLGIVIVGLAVVVGIQAFGENQKKANADALVNDGVRIASDAQAWVLKPQAFGGGDGATTGLDFNDLGYTNADGTYTNLNGDYTMDATATDVLISGQSTANNNYVAVAVWGTAPGCIATEIASDEAPEKPSKPSGCTDAQSF